MTPEQYERIREIFLAAREKDPAQRVEFLDHACGANDVVRTEVESLLSNDEKADTFLRTPVLGESFAIGNPESIASSAAAGAINLDSADRDTGPSIPSTYPKRIGQYRILDVLGEGGMGVVYRAEQENPRRTVALKVIKPGIESREMLRRFEHEGQVLGWLQHPGIAQIFEAGTTDTEQGLQPFFAMELVRGQPLTKYAKTQELTIRSRLELVAKVCDAIHHAHQKGVIHRDLKPGNILVDDSGQPKVLDFGVARATDADIRTTTLQTDVGQLIGTIAYMSPEQVAGDSRELDTRSDVYALGVILYELLTGRLPLDVSHKTVPQAARVITEDEPTSLSSVNRAFRGDIDTIVAKALEKEKTRRYQSASALADDIQRYLSDQPITARPTTTIYQLRKFARRNKGLVAGVLVAFAALLIAIVGTTSQAVRATRERDRARDAEALAEQRRGEAARQTTIAQAVNDFLNDDLLAAANPEKLGRDVTVRKVLDYATEAIEGKFEDEPLVEAAIRSTLGETLHRLGEYDRATLHLERALELRRAELGEQHCDTLISINDLGLIYEYQGRWKEAEPLYASALEGRRHLLGDDHPNTLMSMSSLATLYFRQTRFDEAEPLLVRALEGLRRVLGEDHPHTLNPMNNLANLYARQGRYDEAESLMIEVLEAKRRVLGAEHPKTLVSMNNLANIYCYQGRYDEAEPLYAKTLEIRRRVLGEEHPRTLNSVGNLGFVYRNMGHYNKAEALYVEALAAQRRLLGEDHPRTLLRMSNLAALYYHQGRYEESERLYVETLEACRRVLGEDHRDTLSCLQALTGSLIALGKLEEAEPLAIECRERHHDVYGAEHDETRKATELLVQLYDAWDKPEQAARWRARMPSSQPADAYSLP